MTDLPSFVHHKRLPGLQTWLRATSPEPTVYGELLVSLAHLGWERGVQELMFHCERLWIDRAMEAASEAGHDLVVRQLLDVASPLANGALAVNLAAQHGRTAVLRALLPFVNAGEQVLLLAAEQGHAETVKVILENNPCDRTAALAVAVKGGHLATAKVLLSTDPSPAGPASLRVLRQLKDDPILTEEDREKGWAVLDQAAGHERTEILLAWVETEPTHLPMTQRRLNRHRAALAADPSKKNLLNSHILFTEVIKNKDVSGLKHRLPHASSDQHQNLAERLIDADWGEGLLALFPWVKNGRDVSSRTDLLATAARRGKLNAVKALIPLCDPRDEGSLALWEAVNWGDVAIFEALLPHCDPTAQKSVVICVAAERGFEPIVRRLLPLCDPATQDSLPFRSAAQQGHLSIAKLLLPHSEPKAQDSDALFQAIENYHEEMACWLVPLTNARTQESLALKQALEKDLPRASRALMPVSNPQEVVEHCLIREATNPDHGARLWARLDEASVELSGEPLRAWKAALPTDRELPKFMAVWRASEAVASAPCRARQRLRS